MFSAIGLTWLKACKGKPSAAKIIEEAIGGTLPEKTPDGCKGSLKGKETGLLAHAAAKKVRAHARGKGDSSDSEDEDGAVIQKGHELFHAYLDRRISPAAQLAQAKKMMQGQHKEHSAKMQKVHETHHQREEAGLQERRQLLLRHAKAQQEHREHEEALKATHRELESSVQRWEDEFGKGAYDYLKQERKLQLVEEEKRKIRIELKVTRRYLEEQEKRRKEELAASLLEMQETNREVEQEKEAQIRADSKRRLDEIETKLERKEKECEELSDEKDDLHDLSKYSGLQNDILQSKNDAFFLVGICVAEFASEAELAEVGKATLSKLRIQARGETQTARGVMRETVRAFLENPAVKLAHLKYIAASLTLGSQDSALAYIGLIMGQKFEDK